jgi:PAS domain S-box-containing protein
VPLVLNEPSAPAGAPPAPTPAEEAAALAARSRRQVDALLGRVFEHAAVGMAVVGLDGAEREAVLEANASFAAIFGRSIGALRGTPVLSACVDPAHAPAVARAMEELQRGAVPIHRGEYRFVRAGGERVWLDLTASLVRGADGAARHRLVHVVDLTALRGAEYVPERQAVQRTSA